MTSARPPGRPLPARRLAFVVPYGEPGESYFPDTVLSWMSARARRLGHVTRVVRVYYDGRDEARDAEVRARLASWLDALAPTDVLVERAFDVAPLLDARARLGARLVMVCRGDGFDPDPRFDVWIGRAPGLFRGRTRRTPTMGDLLAGLDALLEGREAPDARVLALPEVELDLDHDVIAPEGVAVPSAPRVRTLLANVGCPYAADPRGVDLYAGLLGAPGEPPDPTLSLLGCAFCPMGGDYQASPEEALVPWVAAQARAIRAAAPETEGFVLSDQAPLPYLGRLLEETRELSPARWLVAMRADVLLRQRARLERTVETAARHGHAIELYLTGFESFSDAELERYVKGVTASELVQAVHVMRELAEAHPGTFGYRNERGHSLILWSPWTSLDDLDASLGTLRREGLRELFWDLGRNRLRLTHELPITRAAERDGALLGSWPEGDEGAARRKGYAPERPWRFLDARTALAHQLAEGLRERLGRETELAQLRASVALARSCGDLEGAAQRALDAVDRLDAALARWLRGPRPDGSAPRSRFLRAAIIDVGMPCSCGRADCSERDAWVGPERALERLTSALGAPAPSVRATSVPRAVPSEAVLLAGGDAAAHPALPLLLARAREHGGLVGLAMPAVVPVPYEALDALVLDVRARGDVAAFAGALGLAHDPRGARPAIEARLLLSRKLDAVEARALAGAIDDALGPDVIRVVAPLDAIGLDRLDAARAALDAIVAEASARGLALEVSPLAAGPSWRERFPLRRSR